jgi:phytepsin
MVTEKEQGELSARDTPLCSSCQMLVLWIQNQLKQKANKERVFNYVNQVSPLILSCPQDQILVYISI